MSTTKVLLGVVAGAAAGAILGVLFAPAKGAATRRLIAQKTEKQAEDLKEKFNDFIDHVTEKYSQAKEDIDETLDAEATEAKVS
ncbi:MAG: YtxH domain-containing protein [Paludibacter sp.]|nr:YtxH domain-containing protein [Paludibacter sp.]